MSVAINRNYIASAFKGTLELWNPITYIRSIHEFDKEVIVKKLACYHKTCVVLTTEGTVFLFDGLSINRYSTTETITDISADEHQLLLSTRSGNFLYLGGRRGVHLPRLPPPVQARVGPAKTAIIASGRLYIDQVLVEHPLYITDVAVGGAHTVFIDQNNSLYGFGKNNRGQLGKKVVEFAATPILLPLFSKAMKVVAGREHTVVLDACGDAWMTGSNFKGQFGAELGRDEECNYGFVPIGKRVIDVAAIGDITILLQEDGAIIQLGKRV